MDYKVGQILYLTNDKNLKIIPVQVVEEVIRTSISGKTKTYMILFPNNKQTVADITTVKGKIYDSIDDLRLSMIENATNSIDKMILTTTELIKLTFKNDDAQKEDLVIVQKQNDVQVENNNDIITVDLGGGVKAKMKTKELEKVANQ